MQQSSHVGTWQKYSHVGPGGLKCPCCWPQGRTKYSSAARAMLRRHAKKREREEFKLDMLREEKSKIVEFFGNLAEIEREMNAYYAELNARYWEEEDRRALESQREEYMERATCAALNVGDYVFDNQWYKEYGDVLHVSRVSVFNDEDFSFYDRYLSNVAYIWLDRKEQLVKASMYQPTARSLVFDTPPLLASLPAHEADLNKMAQLVVTLDRIGALNEN